MTKPRNLGEFEILILASLVHLGENAYGVTIRQEIEDKTGRSATVGALYSTLNRLEEKKYVTSRTGEATAQRGGRAKRYYELTSLGRQCLERSITGLNNMLQGVKPWRTLPEN